MGISHKIEVENASSRSRKINVHIETPEWRQYVEETDFKKMHGYPSGGAISIELLITAAITIVILIIIATIVMLTLNG